MGSKADVSKRKAEHLRTMIKIGGGLIAPKDREPETVDLPVITRLIAEIKAGGKRVVVVTGSGNFGHLAVRKFGIDDPESVEKVRNSARRIGEIVCGEMGKAGFDSRLVEPHAVWGRKVVDPEIAGTPVFYGDVVDKPSGGWEIYSGEKIIGKLVPVILTAGESVERIIQVSREEGVWDEHRMIIPEINASNWGKIKNAVGTSAGMDVTGGMLHKVEESLEIARKYGIETWIISGREEGRLGEVLVNGKTWGTRVSV